MAEPIDVAKTRLRAAMHARLATLEPPELARRSRLACDHADELLARRRLAAALLYLPMAARGELDVRPLAEALARRGVRICTPRIDWENRTLHAVDAGPDPEVELRRHGVPEPRSGVALDAEELDVVVVPGLAFDAAGGRLGRGGGFYDRFLAAWRSRRPDGRAVGIGLADQLVDRVPREPHDAALDAVVTDAGSIEPAAPP